MSTILRSALVAVAVLAGASSAMAAPSDYRDNGQYNASSEGARAFFDAQQRNGS
jgi:hypothetical protein